MSQANISPGDICRRWGHSFEEDTGDITVYRPADYQFPRARGRAGIEFMADGEFIDWTIGPADAPNGLRGRWQIEGPGRVNVTFEAIDRKPIVFEIASYDDEVLQVRRLPASP